MAISETGERVSEVGRYSGYSERQYDGWERTSRYVEARDGTKLAVDVYRPTRDGVVEEKPLPVVWTAKRYLRATVDEEGNLTSSLISGGMLTRPAPKLLIEHGYVLASADMRGTGASFGNWSECSEPHSTDDGYDVNEWLAEQEFCDGNIGMFGASYEGRMQLNVAASAPPHLKAIMPEVAPFDWYTIVHEGGIYSKRFIQTGQFFRACDLNPTVAPVDEDVDGSLVAQARRGHEEGNDYSATSGEMPYRDSPNPNGFPGWEERSGDALLAGIERSGVASYQTSGFFARVGLEQLLWFANMARSSTAGKHRVLMGPWPGGGIAAALPEYQELWGVETLRFMDYWLKGIDNGIMDEPPVVYATTDSTKNRVVSEWRYAAEWPVPGAVATDFHFAAGPSGTVDSPNDGALRRSAPPTGDGADEYPVDYTVAASLKDTHFNAEPGADFAETDAKCLTFTTEPFESDLEVTGHPVAHLYVSSTADDGAFLVRLMDVDRDGVSTYVTQKRLRASLRKVDPAPCYFFDAPWHSLCQRDAEPIPAGEVVELAFDILPTSYRFRTGHRLRVTVACADQDEFVTEQVDPPPTVTLHRSSEYPSRVTLPLVEPNAR